MIKQNHSTIDKSVNFIEQQLEGFLESRYVRKVEDYFICYLSSQTGCNRGCKFCHLTATGQTTATDSDYQDFLNQALQVFRHYRQEAKPAKYMHYNFMARGEPLANNLFLREADEILFSLANLAKKEDLVPKFGISTIMPKTFATKHGSLTDIFRIITPTIYYSLYSMNENFRHHWMPGAMPVESALDMLAEYQDLTKKIVKIHFTFIKNQNDDRVNLGLMTQAILDRKLKVEFNIVRYNPFSEEQGSETDEDVLLRNVSLLRENFDVKIIPRVGFDVKASCGMFVS